MLKNNRHKWAFALFAILVLFSGCVASTSGPQSVSVSVSPQTPAADSSLSSSFSGVVTDRGTNLEWLAGPDRDMDYKAAQSWVRSCTVAGGGWRMPTVMEIKTLHQSMGSQSMASRLKTGGLWVWAEPRGTADAWFFYLNLGFESWGSNRDFENGRALAVRNRR